MEPSRYLGEKRTPPVWGWYVGLCALGALANFGLIAFGIFWLGQRELLEREAQYPPGLAEFYGWMFIAMGLIFGIGNVILPFLPKKPWFYVLHMTNIVAAGLTVCCLPLAVPLFINWLKPDVREMFDFK